MTSTHRPLNDKDRAFLSRAQRDIELFGSDVTDDLILFIWPFLVLSFILSIIWIGICRLTGLQPSGVTWRDAPVSEWGVYLICVAVFLYQVHFITRYIFQGRQFRKKSLAKIAAELDHNQVEETEMTVEAVKCCVENEHKGRIYFYLLSDGRIRVRYDHDSMYFDGGYDPSGVKPQVSREMTVIHFKHLDEFRYEFGPTSLRTPKAFDLNLPPDQWPEDNTWCDIPWDNLERVLGA